MNFFLSDLNISKIHESSLTTGNSAHNLGFIFYEHLTFSDQITALSRSCCYHIRELRSIRPYIGFKIASIIATLIVYSKLDYCKLDYSIITFQTVNLTGSNRFKTLLLVLLLKLLNITPILKSLRWLKVNERIDYKLLSVTYKYNHST